MSELIRWEADSDGVVLLTVDDPNSSVNIMNDAFTESLVRTVRRLQDQRESITGVIITSAKDTFFAGGDLTFLINADKEHIQELWDWLNVTKTALRELETFGRPVVAAMNGSALGGGLEIALACHHRIAINGARSRFGFPEVTLGLLPGAGGVIRTVRMLGISDALTRLLLRGQRLTPSAAVAAGIVDELVPDRDQLIARAKQWIADNPDAGQPWDKLGYRIPGGTPAEPKFAGNLPAFPANLRKQLKGAPLPAPRSILAAAVEGAQVDVDTALRIESRYFAELATGQTAKNMTKAFFFDMQSITKGSSRPGEFPRYTAKKVGVLGAGMMGAGIAYSCARSGMDVILKDVTLDAAERGKAYTAKLLDNQLSRGQITAGQHEDILARIVPTTQTDDLNGCDLVVEAVFENAELKHKVFTETEHAVEDNALLASNTSTLPITELATAVQRQEDFVGLHFFSPVDKMPLVEIIRGQRTSDAAVAKAFDVVLQLKKTPIVVNDSRGFFTSRVISTFLNEGVAMLGEGLPAASIEQATSQAGYPTPVLALVDELTLTLLGKIRDEYKKAAGDSWKAHPAESVLDRMVEEFARTGRAGGAGFYDYMDGQRTNLWPGLAEHFGGKTEIPFADMKERLLFIEALEAVACLDEGVITSVADANIGSLLGIGFPPWTGGVLQYITGYPGGLAGFVARADELAQRYGERFTPPESLRSRAATGTDFR